MEYNAKVLIVDDNPEIREVIHILLESEGYCATEASNGASAIEIMRDNTDIDLIIMDIMMPGISGVEACRQIRKFSTAPVLFLTAKSQDSDKSDAYGNGGDDYLVKPFSQTDLLLKVKSLLRRYYIYKGKEQPVNKSTDIQLKSIIIDTVNRSTTKDGQKVVLTDKEFDILLFLAQHRGQVLNAETIFEHVWQEKYLQTSINTIMVHILNLRRKLEDDPSNPQIVHTIWGKGYQVD